MIASNRSSSATIVMRWLIKLTETSSTPSSFAIARSILAAQFAQSRSCSLKTFLINFLLFSRKAAVFY